MDPGDKHRDDSLAALGRSLVGADLGDRALAVLQPPAVLHRPVVHGVEGLSPQRDLGHLRPAWIDQRLPRDGDQVGLALLQDGLGGRQLNGW